MNGTCELCAAWPADKEYRDLESNLPQLFWVFRSPARPYQVTHDSVKRNDCRDVVVVVDKWWWLLLNIVTCGARDGLFPVKEMLCEREFMGFVLEELKADEERNLSSLLLLGLLDASLYIYSPDIAMSRLL